MVSCLDKNLGRILRALDELNTAGKTIVFLLTDKGTGTDIVNLWRNGMKVPGGKSTLTDRGTHVPLLIRWPGRIQAESTCGDLIDFSKLLLPTLCDLAQAPLPADEIYGCTFSPQLIGEPDHTRNSIHIQHQDQRQVRNREYMIDHQGRLKRVAALGQKPDKTRNPENEAAAQKALKTAVDTKTMQHPTRAESGRSSPSPDRSSRRARTPRASGLGAGPACRGSG